MRQSRRHFLGATGAGLAAAAGFTRWLGCSRTPPPPSRVDGAPGVELALQDGTFPDYTHDLERYLVRLASDARDRRRKIINAISTQQHVLDRRRAVVQELWTML